jgi:chorismate--pyruvate lyase
MSINKLSAHLNADSLALLTERSSLTDLMTRLMGRPPVLNCLAEGKAQAGFVDNHILGIPPRNYAHIREITMGTTSADWLFARTVIPVTTLTGNAKRLVRMNRNPLGKILFGPLNAVRTQMRLDIVFADEVNLLDFEIPTDFPLWQRRSLFELKTGPLLITEIFLPDCPVYES